jgi:hypothetical protein
LCLLTGTSESGADPNPNLSKTGKNTIFHGFERKNSRENLVEKTYKKSFGYGQVQDPFPALELVSEISEL